MGRLRGDCGDSVGWKRELEIRKVKKTKSPFSYSGDNRKYDGSSLDFPI